MRSNLNKNYLERLEERRKQNALIPKPNYHYRNLIESTNLLALNPTIKDSILAIEGALVNNDLNLKYHEVKKLQEIKLFLEIGILDKSVTMQEIMNKQLKL